MEAATSKFGADGRASMNTVDEAWVTTVALTRPIRLARRGDTKTTPAVSRLVRPRTRPLSASDTPYAAENQNAIRGTKSPAPSAMITL